MRCTRAGGAEHFNNSFFFLLTRKHQSNNVIVLKALVRCPERHQELIAEKSVALHTDVSLLFEEPSVDCIVRHSIGSERKTTSFNVSFKPHH